MKDSRNPLSSRRGAIILAGGDSKRLGQPKALLDFNGRPLIEVIVNRLNTYFHEITVVTDRPYSFSGLPVQFAGDLLTERQKSPLRGIHAGLKASDLPCQFVAACDMPFLNLELINYMVQFTSEYDAVVPCIGSYYQPLHSFYSRNCIGIIDKQLQRGLYKVSDFYSNLKVRFINDREIMQYDPDQESFININTWPDYERALKIFSDRT